MDGVVEEGGTRATGAQCTGLHDGKMQENNESGNSELEGLEGREGGAMEVESMRAPAQVV